MLHLKIVCVLALALVACKKEAGKTEPAGGDKAGEMKADPKPADPKPTGAPAGDPPASGDTKAAAPDHSDPAKVVEAIFAAARDGKADALAGLCDPAGTGDGDVKSLCALKVGDPTWERFVRDFSKGKVEGAPTVEGDTAEVTFLFGRDGTKQEKMNLSRVGGKWYLGSF